MQYNLQLSDVIKDPGSFYISTWPSLASFLPRWFPWWLPVILATCSFSCLAGEKLIFSIDCMAFLSVCLGSLVTGPPWTKRDARESPAPMGLDDLGSAPVNGVGLLGMKCWRNRNFLGSKEGIENGCWVASLQWSRWNLIWVSSNL